MIKGLMGSLATDLFSDENRDELIKEINEDVDIPLFNEKTEEKIFLALFFTRYPNKIIATIDKYTQWAIGLPPKRISEPNNIPIGNKILYLLLI